MKRRKKKYNPLKKYQEGGEVKETKPNPKSEKWDEKSSGAFDAYMAGMASAEQDAEPEDLMKGRTFIPRMSAAAKASLMAGAKKLMDKRKDKKLFMDEGGTKEEYRSLSKEMLKNKRRKDLGLDTDTEEKMESKNTNYDPLKKLARPEKEEPEAEETVARYGAKILKKYANGGKTDPPKKESSAEKTANKVRAQVAKQDSAKAYQAKMAAFAGYSSDRKDNVDPSEVYDFALNKLEKTREDRVKKILEKKHGISTAKPAKKITPNIKIKKAKR